MLHLRFHIQKMFQTINIFYCLVHLNSLIFNFVQIHGSISHILVLVVWKNVIEFQGLRSCLYLYDFFILLKVFRNQAASALANYLIVVDVFDDFLRISCLYLHFSTPNRTDDLLINLYCNNGLSIIYQNLFSNELFFGPCHLTYVLQLSCSHLSYSCRLAAFGIQYCLLCALPCYSRYSFIELFFHQDPFQMNSQSFDRQMILKLPYYAYFCGLNNEKCTIGEFKHILKWISSHSHKRTKERIVSHTSKPHHHLLHLGERVASIDSLNLTFSLTIASSTHYEILLQNDR